MTAAWPAWITPPALQDGFGENPEPNAIDFSPEVGPPKTRRRSSLSNDLLAVVGWYSSQDWEDIKNFYRATLSDGTLRFTMIHPRTKTTGTWMFVPKTPPKVNSTFGLTFVVGFSLRLISGGLLPPAFKFNRPANSQYLGAL